MRTLLCLAFFGLFAQMATAQVLEINSPTKTNLKCAIIVPPTGEATSPAIYVFGEQGLGFVSKDKCASWKQLDLDPIQKRTINLVAKVNDTLIFISGGKENDLLKYSTDNGASFKDFPFKTLDASGKLQIRPVCAIIPLNHWFYGIVAFMQVNTFAMWQDFRFMNAGFPLQQAYLGGPSDAFTYLGGTKDGDYVATYVRAMSHGTNGWFPVFGISVLTLKPNSDYSISTGQSWNDSITCLSSNNGTCLTAFYSKESYEYHQAGRYSYEAICAPTKGIQSFTQFRYFPELGKEMSIKSSLITPPHSLFWHVGGDVNGKNGFIIRDGAIIQRSQSSALNMLIDFSDGSTDGILAVGNNGKIYSNRSDLTPNLSNPVISLIRTDYFSAYPNPFSTELVVKSSSKIIATLNDFLGRTLKQIPLESGDNLISLADLKPGIYFLTNKQQTLKLIKQ